MNDLLSLGLHWEWKKQTVQWSGARPGDTVLDLCCGSGDITFLLAEAVGPTGMVSKHCFTKSLSLAHVCVQIGYHWYILQVIGLDFAQDMLDYASERETDRRAKSNNIANMRYRQPYKHINKNT